LDVAAQGAAAGRSEAEAERRAASNPSGRTKIISDNQ
jgi:hypothetical protein